MITTNLFQARRTEARMLRPRGLAARFIVAVLAALPAAAMAQNVLEAVTFNPGPGGQVDVVMTLSRPASGPKLFTTDSPPRIAIDFDNTRNGLAERRIAVGVGGATAISAIEAAGRTRVVVELVRPTAYTTRMEGNNLILSVGASGTASAGQAINSNDPSKAVSGRPEIANVDFRRGKNGEGRVIVSFTSDGVAADLRKQGGRVIVELRNVALPPQFAQRLDVTDFATPVESIETRALPNGVRMEIVADGEFEQLAYQSGSEYVIEISPVRVESEAEKLLKEPEYAGERVTFNFQDIPVRSVLQLIADVSELNVVVADSVSGNVTLRLVNVPWDQALDIILQAKGLDKRRRGGVIWVAPTAEIAAREQALEDARIALEDRAPLVSEYIPINYGSAKDIAELLTNDALRGQQGGAGGGSTGSQAQQRSGGFLSSRGSVTFDERTNTLLINDSAEKIAEVRQLISLLDRPVDQVLIESRIVIADETFGREIGARFGISGAYEDSNGNVVSTGGTSNATDNMLNEALGNRRQGRTSGLPVGVPGRTGQGIQVPNLGQRLNVNLPLTNAAGSFALAVLGQDYLLDLELSALSQEGKGEIVSAPRVITANQREAVITQGDEIGYVTTTTDDRGNQTRQIEFKPVVLELKVTPTITQDQRVFLTMNVRKDDLAGFITTVDGAIPQITTRAVNTAVLVQNGQTVVLGGVYEFSSRNDLTKVPFLGDLPALGNLFRTKSSSSTKAELLIFVTPKILDQGNR